MGLRSRIAEVGRRSRFAGDTRGGLLTWAALAAPALVAMACGVVDIGLAQSEGARLRDLAQGAALAGAADLTLSVSSSAVAERAKGWAESELAEWPNAPPVQVSAAIITLEDGRRGVRVNVHGNRPSVFGRIVPPGGWRFDLSAVAAPLSTTPLCVLALQRDHNNVINIKDDGLLSAPACAAHSNRDIVVQSQGRLRAARVEAATSISGDVEPNGLGDVPTIEDPFAQMALTAPSGFNTGDLVYDTGVHYLPAGVHRKHITLRGDAVLHLEAGEHWFVHSDFTAKENARVEGDDVVVLFDNGSKFQFHDDAMVRLTGRESGPFSGFVLIATRQNTHDFTITSDHVETLLGVIYAPNARLVVEGRAQVARDSAWTVIVAKALMLDGNPAVYLNANYRSSDVPVPSGVGPRAGVRLVQ